MKAMAQYASLHSVDLFQILVCSQVDDSVPLDYLEIKLNVNGEPKFICSMIHVMYAMTQFA